MSTDIDITYAVLAVRDKFLETLDSDGYPRFHDESEINCGSCMLFAAAVCAFVNGAFMVWDTDRIPNGREDFVVPSHCFIQYKDRYYDSETPNGVLDWRDLPIFHEINLREQQQQQQQQQQEREEEQEQQQQLISL